MTRTLTGTFKSMDQARNVEDELLSSGIPREKIYIDEKAKTIKILVPEATMPGVTAILERHQLSGLSH
jgi:hypothetical protein